MLMLRKGGCFHSELDVLMDTIRVVQKPFKLLWSMGPHNEGVIHIRKLVEVVVGCIIQCFLLEIFHLEVSSHGRKWWCHHHFASLLVDPATKSKVGRCQDMSVGPLYPLWTALLGTWHFSDACTRQACSIIQRPIATVDSHLPNGKGPGCCAYCRHWNLLHFLVLLCILTCDPIIQGPVNTGQFTSQVVVNFY